MPRRVAPLFDTQVKNAKAKAKQYALRDGEGLYLLVTPTGGKLWRMDYRYEGKRLTLAVGAYPVLSLADARGKRLSAQQQIANGINPNTVKKVLRNTVIGDNTFEAVAREWHTKFLSTWVEKHGYFKLQRLESNIFPWIGKMAVDEVTAPDLLKPLQIIEARGSVDLAHRVRTTCTQIFGYAIATGRCVRNVSMDLKGALPPADGKHHAAFTKPDELAKFLRAVPEYNGSFLTLCALRLLPLLLLRPVELRSVEWVWIIDNQIHFPASIMKMKLPHIVPLCKQAVAVLNEVRHISGHTKYVFPSNISKQRPMSENTVNTALRRMGYDKTEVTGHGFRATARTIMDEVLKIRVDLIEHQLAHSVRDANGRAYNRTTHIEDRTVMMQQWSDYLDSINN